MLSFNVKQFFPTSSINYYSVLVTVSGHTLIKYSVSCNNTADPLTVVSTGGNVDGNNCGGNGHETEGNSDPHQGENKHKKGCFRPKAFFFFSETATKVEKSRVLIMYERFLTGKTRMMNY